MKLNLLDKLQLNRIEKKIEKKKKQLVKHSIELEDGKSYGIHIVLFSSEFWFHENVKIVLENKGYKVIRFVLNPKVIISWR